MLPARDTRPIPTLPSVEELEALTTARLNAMFARPRLGVWSGLVSAALGCVTGVLVMLLYAAPVPAQPLLTGQQQTLYDLVQALAQAPTTDQAWVIMARIERVVKAIHPQPRPQPEALLPTAAAADRRFP